MFVNRLSELALLENLYRSEQAELFVLYGRRRVGKTELLAHFCEGKRHIFFVADQNSEQVLRANLSKVIDTELFSGASAGAVYSTWEDLFNALTRQAQQERLIVVLDEFPYLIAAYPPLASVLQRLWDRTLKNSRIMLILNGSYIGMMEEAVLGYQAPLYGRRTAQYLLEPLEFLDAQAFFQPYTPEDRLRAFAVYGGTPAYLQTIQPARSLKDNILDGILQRGAVLYDEVRFILQQELREPRNYFAILQAIASGSTRQNEIKLATGLESIAPYLETLQQLHLVERAVPVTETKPHKSRRGIYRLKDNYLRFWFRFVLPNLSQLERGAARMVFDAAIRPELDLFTSIVFEQVCRQILWRMGLEGRLPFVPRQIGGWWQANREVDLALLGEDQLMVVECKWSRRAAGTDILAELEARAGDVLHEAGMKNASILICSRSGFTEGLLAMAQHRQDLLLMDWKEMLE